VAGTVAWEDRFTCKSRSLAARVSDTAAATNSSCTRYALDAEGATDSNQWSGRCRHTRTQTERRQRQ
jgi:hypothetical protein